MSKLSQSQPVASLREFAELLARAEVMLGELEDMQDQINIPFYMARLKLRTELRFALGLDLDPVQNAVRVAREATEKGE